MLFFIFVITSDRQNNWPPVPSCCPVGPCFYQDFSVDIPLEFQRTVKFVYYLWACEYLMSFNNSISNRMKVIKLENDEIYSHLD
jgi:hypothetical protein